VDALKGLTAFELMRKPRENNGRPKAGTPSERFKDLSLRRWSHGVRHIRLKRNTVHFLVGQFMSLPVSTAPGGGREHYESNILNWTDVVTPGWYERSD